MSGPLNEALMNDVLGHERSGEATPFPLGGGGNLEVRRVRRGTEEEKIKESQIYPQVTNNFTSEDLTLVFMG